VFDHRASSDAVQDRMLEHTDSREDTRIRFDLMAIVRLETGAEVHDKMPSRRGREGTRTVELEDEARGVHAGS